MKWSLVLFFMAYSLLCLGQSSAEAYLNRYSLSKDSIAELTFKSKEQFQAFIKEFEEKEGFELPKFLIYDNTGKLLKHRLDVLQSACGKGDVSRLKRSYHKSLPTLDELNVYFNETIAKPSESAYVVIFVWHEAADKYNKHTFDTYKAWKNDDDLTMYFLNLQVEK